MRTARAANPSSTPRAAKEAPGRCALEGNHELVPLFAAELARLDSRIECMTMSRDAVRRHLRHRNRPPGTPLKAPAGDAGRWRF